MIVGMTEGLKIWGVESVPLLVELGLTEQSKLGKGAMAPPVPIAPTALYTLHITFTMYSRVMQRVQDNNEGHFEL